MPDFQLLMMILVLLSLSTGCASVKYYQKERLADRTMVFDYDVVPSMTRADIITTREGSIGGFSSANAAGCSCK